MWPRQHANTCHIPADFRHDWRRPDKNKGNALRMSFGFGKFVVSLGMLTTVLGTSLPATAQSGAASWYGSGHRTANGEHFNPNGLTAAHRSLPFGTRVRVENKRTGRSVVVRINDRGPFVRGRIIDLSRGSARALGMGGTTYVSLQVLN